MEKKFKIRGYGRTELARMYYGDNLSDKSCLRWFMRELGYVPGLMEELEALGFTPKNKIFTRSQVKLIVDALGRPDL